MGSSTKRISRCLIRFCCIHAFKSFDGGPNEPGGVRKGSGNYLLLISRSEKCTDQEIIAKYLAKDVKSS
jgi:hypothetical protein